MNEMIQATLGYLVPSDEKPVYYASIGGADAALSTSGLFEDRVISIEDARLLDRNMSLDREGFQLVAHQSAVTDFYDDAQIDDIYQEEAEMIIKQATGAKDVVVFDNTRRSDAKSIRGDQLSREPSAVIHNDYTDASAEKRLRQILDTHAAEERLKGRFAIINLWRSFGGPALTTPLTICDASSCLEENLIASERRAKDRIGELQLVTYHPDQRWYWYSGMDRDEVMLLKTFDSDRSGVARRAVHSAFVNPDAPSDAPPRESLETRCFVFF